MNYWDSVGRWINTLLVFIVGVLAFDALFRLLEANEANVIVTFVRGLAVVFLVPFQGMFGEQDYVLTTLIGVLGYALLAGIALGVLRSLQASRAQAAPPVPSEAPVARTVAERSAAPTVAERVDVPPAAAQPAPDSPDRALRSADHSERSAPRERPDRARSNGRSPRTRRGTDGAERTPTDAVGRVRRGRPRNRATANPTGTVTPEADTGA